MKEFKSNFLFLEKKYPFLFNIASAAEYHLYSDPSASLTKARLIAEKITDIVYVLHGLESNKGGSFSNQLKELKYKEAVPARILDLFYTIKSKGNKAVHQNEASYEEAVLGLTTIFHVCVWFMQTYSGSQSNIDNAFISPPNLDARHALFLLEKEYSALESKFVALRNKQKKLTPKQEDKIITASFKIAAGLHLTETETREIIDQQLRNVGWEVDTLNIRYAKGSRPEPGKNIAIAEWPVGELYADYALFIGLEFYGIVEAKKMSRDVISDLGQAKIYSKKAENKFESKLLIGKWGTYKVPFMFSTNGRPYQKQLENKSGIWFLDGRKTNNHPRPLKSWYSPEGLKALLSRDIDKANKELKNEDADYLSDAKGLNLRKYQIDAIEAVEKKIIEKKDDRRALVAMATGTGKTRTIIGLCYRLIKANRFKRILFLVDRSLLGKQATDFFKDAKVNATETFVDMYDVQELGDIKPDLDTRLHFATVQGMVKRIYYNKDQKEVPPIDSYDCVIIDEAHRGYTLDKEMDEDELDFKNQDDYLSKYRKVLEYFDAYRIGLTATPALHTTEIFGPAVFRYTYRQAVIDGFLIDHEPPHILKTKLSEDGIIWKKGEKPKAWDRATNKIVELDKLADELKIDVDNFNKLVITEPFNKAILSQLAKELDPEGNEKTLIFAATDEHADMVVKILKEEYERQGIEVDDEAIVKITGTVYGREELVTRYKNEQLPNIVVTVDLLTTGVDVASICNLVFIRRVKSRILYEQMLGRATRTCDEIKKEVFHIYDAVRLYESLQDYTDMKPVVVDPETTFASLTEEMGKIKKKERLEKQIEQIIAKLQRKRKILVGENAIKFGYLSGGQTPEDFINWLKNIDPSKAGAQFKKKIKVFQFLDEMKGVSAVQFVSDHEDKFIGKERGYGKGVKPGDYLESFRNYISNNQNKITALKIVCTRPKELTRKALRELLLELDIAGYNTAALNTAWRETKNVDIAADIISFIRSFALGTTIISHNERIEGAMRKIKALKDWSKVQLNWLDRIEQQLLHESVIDLESFDQAPFKSEGGYAKLNKVFENEFDKVLNNINEQLYAQGA